jgi:hypothetical protein
VGFCLGTGRRGQFGFDAAEIRLAALLGVDGLQQFFLGFAAVQRDPEITGNLPQLPQGQPGQW